MGEGVLSQATTSARARGAQSAPARLAPDAQRAARRTLRRQIAHLDAEIGTAVVESFSVRGRGEGSRPARRDLSGPARVLDLGELERVRDELAARLQAVHAANADRAERQRVARAELTEMLREPERHRLRRISCEDLGEPGCGVWEVRPRLGLIGMLAGWWQVKLSSGCPLAGR